MHHSQAFPKRQMQPSQSHVASRSQRQCRIKRISCFTHNVQCVQGCIARSTVLLQLLTLTNYESLPCPLMWSPIQLHVLHDASACSASCQHPVLFLPSWHMTWSSRAPHLPQMHNMTRRCLRLTGSTYAPEGELLDSRGRPAQLPADMPALHQIASCSALCNDSSLCFAAGKLMLSHPSPFF